MEKYVKENKEKYLEGRMRGRDLAPFMSGTSDLPIYRLYGVVVHLDIMNTAFSGHCVCYVKNFQSRWFKVDHSVVCLSFHYLHILRANFFGS